MTDKCFEKGPAFKVSAFFQHLKERVRIVQTVEVAVGGLKPDLVNVRAVLWPGQAQDCRTGFASLPQVEGLANVAAGAATQRLERAGQNGSASNLTSLLLLPSQTQGGEED